MTNSLLLPEVQNVLERLHDLADARDEAIVRQVRGNEAVWNNSTSEQKAAMLQDALLPVDRDAGRFLYAVARSISAKRIVEFGTSFGISTIYFAAAVKDNGGGVVKQCVEMYRGIVYGRASIGDYGVPMPKCLGQVGGVLAYSRIGA